MTCSGRGTCPVCGGILTCDASRITLYSLNAAAANPSSIPTWILTGTANVAWTNGPYFTNSLLPWNGAITSSSTSWPAGIAPSRTAPSASKDASAPRRTRKASGARRRSREG